MSNLFIYERIIGLRNKYVKGNYSYLDLRLEILNELLSTAFRNNDSLPTKLDLCIDTTLVTEASDIALEILKDLGFKASTAFSQYTLKRAVMNTPVLFQFCCR